MKGNIMNNNEAINIQEKEEDVRYAKNTLYVLMGLTILGAIIFSDPWRLIDLSFLAILAFLVTFNNSKTALLIACIYYAIDSIRKHCKTSNYNKYHYNTIHFITVVGSNLILHIMNLSDLNIFH